MSNTAFSLHGQISVDVRQSIDNVKKFRGELNTAYASLQQVMQGTAKAATVNLDTKGLKSGLDDAVRQNKRAAGQMLDAHEKAHKKLHTSWDNALRENETRNKRATATFNKDWDNALRENARRFEQTQKANERAAQRSAQEQAKAAQQFERTWDNALRENETRNKRAAKNFEKTWESAIRENTRRMQQAQREQERALSKRSDARSSLSESFSNAATMGGAGAVAGFVLAAKQGAEFRQEMANVNSIAQLTEAQLKSLQNQVVAIASDDKILHGPKALATALYDVYSSGFKGKQALDILRESAEGATAGQTDAATAGRVLMATLNSHIGGVSNASQAMDVLFKIVDRGVLRFEDLAGSLGAVLPTAEKAGISLQQIGAYIAVATKSGQSASEAVNDLLNLITKIANPSKEAEANFKNLGISYGFAALQAKGLPGILAEIQAKTGGNADAIKRLLPDMQAQRGALTALKGAGADYRAELEEMGKASDGLGAKKKALTEQLKGEGAQIALVKKQFELLSVEASGVLMPILSRLLTALTNTFKWFRSLDQATKDNIIRTGLYGGVLGHVSEVMLY
jgi:TP901 family phage tail tape measure protein